jgi:zona occludens toxin
VIELITGAPGSGKSYNSVRLIARSVEAGRVVVTNVPLCEDWAERLSCRGWHRYASEQHRLERQRRFEALVYQTDDLQEILRVRVEGTDEGRADMILDECHRWLNSRMWDSLPGLTRDDAIRMRQRLVDFFSAHRHYGYDVYLITQDPENIDKQIRKLFEYHVMLKNLRKVKLLGVTVFPLNLFVAVRVWNDRERTKVGFTVYGLDKAIADLYHTHSLHGVDWPEDAIIMPKGAPGGPASARRAPAEDSLVPGSTPWVV